MMLSMLVFLSAKGHCYKKDKKKEIERTHIESSVF
jgi:hypothetical protein